MKKAIIMLLAIAMITIWGGVYAFRSYKLIGFPAYLQMRLTTSLVVIPGAWSLTPEDAYSTYFSSQIDVSTYEPYFVITSIPANFTTSVIYLSAE
ncbi:hypothetical protein [Deminuibacter soli]|uniref:hypothetical protein n=1 Tax=Deminuibacter soli TaxID=2291815 RepID=UPI0011C1BD81|nr:hypothetical protein [Deminuibacter soli]